MVSGAAAPPTFEPTREPAVIPRLIRGLESDETREQSLDLLCKPVASQPVTKMPFIRASMPEYLYAFLNTMNSERNYECLRLTCLEVIRSLAKVDHPDVFVYLLSTEIFPSCLRCMEFGRT